MLKLLTLSLSVAMLLPAWAGPAATRTGAAHNLFFEAENFKVEGDGWQARELGVQTRQASRAKALSGANGNVDSTALQEIEIPHAGTWRIWARYMIHSLYRGPFEVDVLSGDRVVATQAFDVAYKPGTPDWGYEWDSFDAPLSAGTYTLRLRKFQQQNAAGYARNVDAFLITDDLKQKPDHLPFGPQTWMKVTLGDGYDKPVQIHIFADHYRAPWYGHYALTKGTFEAAIEPSRPELKLSNGESTGWLNITATVYQDSGARLTVYPAHTYWERSRRFKAAIEFAPRPSDDAVVRKFEVNQEPSTIHIVLPPNLEGRDNIANLRTDADYAREYGALADSYKWPKIGKAPQRFPFFVTAQMDPEAVDKQVLERELKTLSYFGFNGAGALAAPRYGYNHGSIGGAGWHLKGSYSAPDLDKLEKEAAQSYSSLTAAGLKPEQIKFAMAMDEPMGEAASVLAADPASIAGFRDWLKSRKLTPSDLLANSWDEVKPVLETEAERFPALHYYTQQFRTVALGKFLEIQRQLLKKQWKADFPVVANFSDGAVYFANFYGQGVDYFTLLHETGQNAIWSEDWSNQASTYQHASYNVELMRAAARKNGQVLGHYLIAYAGRSGYDIRLKAISEAARGVKMFESFAYGPVWATHENSPWQKSPHIWGDHAAAVREIGAVEEFLLPARPQPAQVALLYSSASDIWSLGHNLAPGFERMNTWLALAHAQIPVDVVHESEVAGGLLNTYKVCYLSGPNLTRAAALKLRDWVKAGGTLVLTAGAGQRDEFNRNLDVLDTMLPYRRAPLQTLEAFNSAGLFLTSLQPQGTALAGKARMDVLSIKQNFEGITPRNGQSIEATFADGSPATVRSAVGKGWIVSHGYLPSLDYMRRALLAKGNVEARRQQLKSESGVPSPEDVVPLKIAEKSYNPWQYPAEVREFVLKPVRQAKIAAPITCSVPMVDAVYMTSEKGLVIPLANYTLQPIKNMTLDIAIEKPVREVRSVHQGLLQYKALSANKIRVSLPLDCTDFITVR